MASCGFDRSVRPKAGAAPEIEIKDAKIFTLSNGMKVFLVENHKLPTVYYSLSIDVRPKTDSEKAGLETMFSEVFGTASKTRSKEEINLDFDMAGANFNFSSRGANISGLVNYQDEMLTNFANVLFNPVFKQEELNLARDKQKDVLKMLESDQDQMANRLANIVAYGKEHPFGQAETVKTLDNITVKDLENYYDTYFAANVMRLVIVGDITEEQAKTNAEKYFGAAVKKDVPYEEYVSPEIPEGDRVAAFDVPGTAQSVVSIVYPVVYQTGVPDAEAARLANQILGGSATGRLFANLRETHGYTYGAYSSLRPNEIIGFFRASSSVKGNVTDSAVHEILAEMRRIISEPVKAEELEAAKALIAGEIGRSLEAPATLARFALDIDKYKLPADYYKNYLKRLYAVTAQDVQNAANRYIKPDNAWIVVTGDKKNAVKLADFAANKQVEFYNTEGNRVEVSVETASTDMTAEKVIEKYIESLGGKNAIAAIKDCKKTAIASIQGQAIDQIEMFKAPDKYYISVETQGIAVQKIIYDGVKAKSSGMQEVPEDQLADFKDQAHICHEMYLAKNGYSLKVTGIEKVDGKDAYAVEAVKGKTNRTYYFDTNTGLKVKTVDNMETPQGNMSQITEFSDYRVVSGVKFPYVAKQKVANMEITSTTKSIEVNKGLNDDLFK
jgi:predicted Zn-dependent peptidase